MSQQARDAIWRVELSDESATAALAAEIAELVGADDLVTLSGDLGAGKTAFARALIRRLVGDPELEAPSPTFTLMQIYDGAAFPIVHADLYRIKEPSELAELGWDEAAEGALVLVEWPDRAGSSLTADRLDVALYNDSERGENFRRAEITGHGALAARLARFRGTRAILAAAGWSDAQRRHMQGDASSRSYERLTRANGEHAILMISPPRSDGPPVRGGKSYSAVARLAETIRPFVAIDRALRAEGVSAPAIYAVDFEGGLAVLEDLGQEGVIDANGVVPERYGEAVCLLADLHACSLADQVPVEDGVYHIPPYDFDALSIELELLLDWYAPHIAKAHLGSGARATFLNLWRTALAEIVGARPTWTLRDFHSPNLLWLAEREGRARVGVIDFQDCVMGHPAYDVVSLLQDARVDVADDVELKLLGAYARVRKQADPSFDMAAFARAYAILGAQRATKILGIFARLDKRDRKPVYLSHIPRMKAYLAKNLGHPALTDLKIWYELSMPELFVSTSRDLDAAT